MKKALLVSDTYTPEIGAAPRRLSFMIKSLVSQGYEVEVLTSIPNYPFGKIYDGYHNKPFHSEEGIHGEKVWRCPSLVSPYSGKAWHRLMRGASLCFYSLLYIKRLFSFRPNIIIAQCPPMFMPFIGSLFAKAINAKFILNISDLWPEAIYDLKIDIGTIKLSILEKILKYLYRTADGFIAQTEEGVASLKKKYPKKHLLLYRTGVEMDKVPPKQDYRHNYPFKFVYVGVLGLAHGMSQVCKAIDFKALGAELHIYGDGFDSGALAKLPLKEKGILMHGAIDADQALEVLHRFDAAFIPQKARIRGTLPSKIYEAMAAGLPILYHGAGEGESLIQKHQCGLVSSPMDIYQLERNIRQFVQLSENDLIRIGQNSFQAAEKNYQRKDLITKLFAFLDTVCLDAT